MAVLLCALAASAGPCVSALADAPPNPVHWRVSITPNADAAQVDGGTLEVSGAIDEGWHVYGPDQLPHGPTPLRITVDQNDFAVPFGPASSSAAQKEFSQSFGVDTTVFTHSFKVRLPVRWAGARPTGSQGIPVSVRFQACSDRECLLPRTLHLIAVQEAARPR